MKDILKLLNNNKAWAERVRRETPDFFTKLKRQQRPKYLWIGCSDSRVPANQITGLLPGEVFVHRNISNQVINTDMNLMCVLRVCHRDPEGAAHHRLRALRVRRHRSKFSN